jgi:diacylglycerol kinase (ATP)
LPAGTANLLATNLGIPKDLAGAVRTGLHGDDRAIDVGRVNGEHFAVMAGTGLDALMIHDTARRNKDRFGRAAYVVSAARRSRRQPVDTEVRIDGRPWFHGRAGCVLVGNVGDIIGGITAFDHARPDDGQLDVAVVTAAGAWQWARTLARATFGHAARSPLVRTTVAHRIDIRTARPHRYELDGGVRAKAAHLKVKVVPSAITVRIPVVRPASPAAAARWSASAPPAP